MFLNQGGSYEKTGFQINKNEMKVDAKVFLEIYLFIYLS